MMSPANKRAAGAARLFFRAIDSPAGIFLFILSAVFLLKLETLFDPPMWDTAMGLFPAAIVLAENGFDYVELLSQPGYGIGGPNTHSTSLITLLTAIVLRLGGASAFPLLHMLQFAFTALALSYLFRLAAPRLGRVAAAALVAAVFFFPLFFVQAGRLYLEIPLALCALAALHEHLKGRYWTAVGWATVAFSIKETGIIVPVFIALLVGLEAGTWRRRIIRIIGVVVPPALLLAIPFLLALSEFTGSTPRYLSRPALPVLLLRMLADLDRNLLRVPDLLLLVLFFLVTAPASFVAIRRRSASNPAVGDVRVEASPTLEQAVGLMIAGFLTFHFLVLPLSLNFTLMLPRYYTIALPFLLLWLALQLKRLKERLVVPVLLAVALVGLVNQDGVFYPPHTTTMAPGNDFSTSERSMAYRKLNAIQSDAMRFLDDTNGSVLTFYGQYEHYLGRYPRLGYVSQPVTMGKAIHLTEGWRKLADETPCFLAVYNQPFLGGRQIRTLLDSVAPAASMQHDTVAEFRRGPYAIIVHRLRRPRADC